jgi:predicted Holliday junction resolvase-like endonuclease
LAEILRTRVKQARKDKINRCQEVLGGNLHPHSIDAT